MIGRLLSALGRAVTFLWALFAVFLPNTLSSIVLFAVLVVLLRFSGDSLGLSNLFRDVVGEHETLDAQTLLSSPTAWTSAMIMFSSGVILLFPCFEWLARQDASGPSQPEKRRRMLRILVVGMLAVYAVLAYVWWRADPTESTPDHELERAIFGAIGGALLFAAGFLASQSYLDRARRWFQLGTHLIVDLGKWLQLRARVRHRKGLLGGALHDFGVDSEVQLERYEQNLRAFLFVLPVGFVLLMALTLETVLPGVAIFVLILTIYLTLQLFTALSHGLRIVVLVAVGLIFWITQGSSENHGFKLTFDGMQGTETASLYDAPVDLAAGYPDPSSCSMGGAGAGGVDLEAAMTEWLKRNRTAQGRDRPKLVIVATSGGAYRASYWTALVLDQLIAESRTPGSPFAGLPEAVRFLTGASGGMVGAAYFTAMAGEDGWPEKTIITQINADIEAAQTKTEGGRDPGEARYHFDVANPIERDSLSAVARQFLQHDAPSLLRSGRLEVDRGKVLERHWQTIRTDFDALRDGEAEGWRPTIVLTPMVVDTGQPLLISNVDFTDHPEIDNNEATQFFDLFPCARESFHLATGVRMSATFPYVSPAVALPTVPPRRVVDAGYFDNYGVAIVNALLSPDEDGCREGADGFCLADWLAEYSSGVILIEVRAFALNTPDEPAEECETPKDDPDKFRGFEFFTSPVEAVLAARGRSQVVRNDQGWRRLEEVFRSRATTRGMPLSRVQLVNCAQGSLNWWVPPDEMALMEDNFTAVWSGEAAQGMARTKSTGSGEERNKTEGPGMRRVLLQAWSQDWSPHRVETR